MAQALKRGDAVVWRVSLGVAFPGEVDTVRGNDVYVLFPNRERPTGGHWLTSEELQHER
ncbi:hypothetical protein HAP48_0042960 [Bradyrhizobium septentrionale]|uniref:Uncharacterized protein n=1 Tax=Bradyrhizobium septentrionale TaxID=1404411 RepID=A0A974A3N6_9BRAD|nr:MULTISPECIES: hypothetical protein [Bradyrhizobium]MCK7671472.1 hypothetical protein [Bradyrhizobium sp. 2S1]UGY15219.1 hypothetical protein HAP48_0042960 [Bradyrhizobium septentrionale]